MELLHDPVIPLLAMYLKKTKTKSKEYLHYYGHCSFVYNNQDLEAADVPTSR